MRIPTAELARCVVCRKDFSVYDAKVVRCECGLSFYACYDCRKAKTDDEITSAGHAARIEEDERERSEAS